MSHSIRIFNHETGNSFKTYKTIQGAEKVAEKAIAALPEDDCYRYMIVATNDGRFKPCVDLSGKDFNLSHYFISKGCSVIG